MCASSSMSTAEGLRLEHIEPCGAEPCKFFTLAVMILLMLFHALKCRCGTSTESVRVLPVTLDKERKPWPLMQNSDFICSLHSLTSRQYVATSLLMTTSHCPSTPLLGPAYSQRTSITRSESNLNPENRNETYRLNTKDYK